MIGAVGDYGLQSTETCQTKARHVYRANRQREPHNNVQDRAQKNFPSNGFASYTSSFCVWRRVLRVVHDAALCPDTRLNSAWILLRSR
jgi:hypothetical protein